MPNTQAELMEVIQRYRACVNEPTADALNHMVSPDFFAVFDVNNGTFETHSCEKYKQGNIDALEYYKGKSPYWDYQTLDIGIRSAPSSSYPLELPFR